MLALRLIYCHRCPRHSLLVDNHGHSAGAVLSLAAENPDGLGIVDHDGEDGDLLLGGTGSNWHEAGPDASNGAVDLGDGSAGVVKVGLGDSVVASPELELNHGSDSSLDVVGVVLESRLTGHTGHGILAN